ncbi:fructose-bisphosphate aldolase, class I [Halorubrum aquaticum]|uniref:fructose-bisphosphate aldolase n=1 Tax=Halorubrum aquaticum TaxID=387340 RepID=A0A1I3C430_9EURY|nr:aldolase [Halorubrum aquaticum]SFH69086.1 fructose-bisphosphate aldolase, class I [Halorubrum aquaticum]
MLPHAADDISRDGKSLILAYDHGLEHGPVDFEPNPATADPERLFELATHEAVTALAVQKGVAEAYYPEYEDDVNLLLKLNGTSNLWRGEPNSAVNCSAEYAAELGADAIGFTVYGGSNHEVEMAEEFREAQEGAREHDMGVVMWSYPRGQGLRNDGSPEVICYGARLGLELGADFVKVKYPGSAEAMGEAVRMAGPTQVVMSGGTMRDDKAFLRNVADAIDAGATGLAVGRNVFQRDDPERILDALEAVVFQEVDPAEALAIAESDD